ncbi:MAG: nucleotidyl transferase AbiEii/AbiGii toxin family protein [Proteobacteria bacterium]|nr:nucleotidyl transferase AbiEii/AbiGii toxin family protein [Pseudomonadota bacterium]
MRAINSGYVQFDALGERERRDAFTLAAQDLGASVQAIEKDFWVCRTIDAMFKGFGRSARPKLYFKGGTSLSKGYRLIKRFSEDIDIVVSRRGLGIGDDADPLAQTSATKRKAATEKAMAKCAAFVSGRMRERLAALMPAGVSVELDSEDNDQCSLRVAYPSLSQRSAYIAPWVKIEVGARGAITPCAERAIEPYVQAVIGEGWELATGGVAMIEAERTFLEKALILHANYCRKRDDPEWRPSDRNHGARHYYDIAMMRDTKTGFVAVRDDALLDDVRETKLKMFFAAGDKLAEATRGSIHLTPQPALKKLLAADYDAMAGMMFHDPPDFDWVLQEVSKAEEAINAPSKSGRSRK